MKMKSQIFFRNAYLSFDMGFYKFKVEFFSGFWIKNKTFDTEEGGGWECRKLIN